MKGALFVVAGLVAVVALYFLSNERPVEHLLTPEEVAIAFELSPVPPPPPSPTNRFADDERAAHFGRALFFDERLSSNGEVSCATCHDPTRGWGDARRLAKGVSHHPTHTMTLWNVAHQRWLFWDGRKDSLWSQALAPLEDPREHGTSRVAVAHVIADDAELRGAYEEIFGELPPLDDAARFPPEGRPVAGQPRHPHAVAWASMTDADRDAIDDVFVHVGKALEAYQRTIVSDDAPFDRFVAGLAANDADAVAAYPEAAQRGFKLFVGDAHCLVCHDGPLFTDLEFHTNLVPTGEGVDPGRPLGISRLLADPFNTLSRHADDDGALGRRKLALKRTGHLLPGEFKTPTLRNVATTAPYMHEGQIATLRDVVEFYNTLEGAAPRGEHTETILQPLGLDDEQVDDLVAFLESLTDASLDETWHVPPPAP